MFRKKKRSLGSYLIVGKEKSEKNHFANLLELFEKKDEIPSLTLTPRRGRGLRSLYDTLFVKIEFLIERGGTKNFDVTEWTDILHMGVFGYANYDYHG